MGHPKLKTIPVFTRVVEGVAKKCGKQEKGKHDDLIVAKGKYYYLVKDQLELGS